MTKRMLALCALIAEENDPDTFLRLVIELNDVFKTARRATKVGDTSPQAFAHSKAVQQ
jgi:hypothetical protein